jgi:hypothetical protein
MRDRGLPRGEKPCNRLVRTSTSGRPDLRQSTAPMNSCYPSPRIRVLKDAANAPERIFMRTCNI